MKTLYKITPFILSVLLMFSCNEEPINYLKQNGLEKYQETMTLTASTESTVNLNPDEPDQVALTFDWTPARQMPDDYILSYVTKVDIKGNEFSAAVRTLEDENVFSKSYTNAQLQQLLIEKWNRPIGKETTLQFRVIAKWDGGEKYVMPEVRTIEVKVRPYKPIMFDADKVYLSGSSVMGTTRYGMTQTLEDPNVWAALLSLKPGKLDIPVIFEGDTTYICQANPTGEIQDGTPESAVMKSEPKYWNITKEGEYRVVVNMIDKTVRINTPDNPLEPKVVEWRPNNAETNPLIRTVVTNLYLRGDPDWSGRDLQLKPSLADPQILVYQGGALKDRCGFAVSRGEKVGDKSFSVHNSYVYTAPMNPDGTQQPRASIGWGAWMPLGGGSGLERGNYYVFPAGTNFIVFDLRNMKIRIEKR